MISRQIKKCSNYNAWPLPFVVYYEIFTELLLKLRFIKIWSNFVNHHAAPGRKHVFYVEPSFVIRFQSEFLSCPCLVF